MSGGLPTEQHGAACYTPPMFTAPLLRDRDFVRLWAAQWISEFGARITREGLPLAALLTIHASPSQLGILAACATAPQVIVGALAGGFVDRARRRAIMIWADFARALLLLGIPIAAWCNALSIMQLYGIAVLVGGLSVLFDLADHAFLPSLIDRDQLADGNAKLSITQAVAEIGGPALAGLLVQALTAPIAIAANAFTYLASALALMRIQKPEALPAAQPPAQDALADVKTGFVVVFGAPLVRPLFLMSVTTALFGSIFGALYTFFVVNVLSLTPFMLGVTIAAGGVGALLGAMLGPAMSRMLGFGPMILTSWALRAVVALLIPLAHGAAPIAMAMLIVGQCVGDGFATAAMIGVTTLRQSVLPNAILGRAGAAFHVGAGAASILGALAGGVLGETIGPRAALFVAALGILAATGWGFASPLARLKAAPAQAG